MSALNPSRASTSGENETQASVNVGVFASQSSLSTVNWDQILNHMLPGLAARYGVNASGKIEMWLRVGWMRRITFPW